MSAPKKHKTEKDQKDAMETPKYRQQAAALEASGAQAAAANAPDSRVAAARADLSPQLPLSYMTLLGLDSMHEQEAYMSKWASDTKEYVDVTLLKFLKVHEEKLSFPVPSSLSLIAPLEISSAASGAQLSAFREVMNYDNLVKSFAQSAQC